MNVEATGTEAPVPLAPPPPTVSAAPPDPALAPAAPPAPQVAPVIVVPAPVVAPPAPPPLVVPQVVATAAPIVSPPPAAPAPLVPDPDLDQEDVREGAVPAGDFVNLPRKSFNRRLSSARSAARREAEENILALAKEAGFSSIEEALGIAKQNRTPKQGPDSVTTTTPATPITSTTPPAAAPAAPIATTPIAPPADASGRSLSVEERRIARDQRKAAQNAKAAADAAQAAADARVAAANATIETERKRAAIGFKLAAQQVTNLDFAIAAFEAHKASLDEEGRKALDTEAGFATWVAETKKANPYMFIHAAPPPPPPPVMVPATTGPAGAVPPAPSPAAVSTMAGDGAKVDFRTMTPQQRVDYSRARGLKI